MCHSCGVAFSHTIHVFFNENGVKKVRSHGLLLRPSAFCLAIHCSGLLEARDFLLDRREFLGHGKD